MAAFTKGQLVTFIGSWDDAGMFYFKHAIVYACGAKRLVLTDAITLEELGRDFTPEVATIESAAVKGKGVFNRLTDEGAVLTCHEISKLYVEQKRQWLEQCIARHSDKAGYVSAMRENIAKLHGPEVHS